MKKVLVTGANSFTGQHLLPVLNIAGFETYCQTRKKLPNSYCADITDFEDLHGLIAEIQPDYVIHLAGISFVEHPRPMELYEVNLLGAENLLKAISKAAPKIKKIILASSASVYGSSGTTNIDEATPTLPLHHYAGSKLAMEHMAKTWMDRLPITIVRPFNYTGPGQDHKFLIPKIVKHYAKKATHIELGDTQIARDFTDIRTICQYYLKLLTEDKATGQIVNLCSGRLITLTEILETLASITGHALDIKVNQEFVRTSVVLERSGNPDKLYSLIGSHNHPHLKETLNWMLEQAC